ncbi:PD-(D/E)XK nuclease-like domain-containing protein [Campylobacter mucosalis]|uniref:Putative exonuclease VIII n=1 Tax=Campylobacter mucosalis CCUG 21559 TaxID=1032067 RepID=A0A6G5QEL2_9BACT|nr:PD-(D/E)XK nuclease-like domain-containing protein [Campylobacter mucosalis]QCD44091.1 putative exonuclease VIII [Campylobacter mucosalis CCUG 21559]QCD44683.1 putative exonuclease VIII [Campylobacter mucosalis CCUG 21559]
MTNKEYHSRPEISKSDLDLLARSPLHFKMKNELKSEPSPSLLLGSLVHKLVLEPNDFDSEYAIEPTCDKRTKEGKAIYAKFLANLGDKVAIEQEQFKVANEIANEVLKMSKEAFLSDGLAEQVYFGEIEGVKVRAKPDFYNEALGVVVDLKTTSDASANGFSKSVANFNYHVQNAFYTEILRQNGKAVNHFLFIAVETKKPYFVGFYELDNEAIELGVKRYTELLELYKFCLERNEWWGYSKKDGDEIKAVQTLSLPTWKFYEAVN